MTYRFPSTHLAGPRISTNHTNDRFPDLTLVSFPHLAVENSLLQDHLQNMAPKDQLPLILLTKTPKTILDGVQPN